MSNQSMMTISASDHVKTNWGWMLALGILFIIGGLFAFIAPFLAGVVVAIVVGVIAVLAGIAQIVQAWRMKSWGGFVWQLVVGVVLVVGGVSIYLNPVAGAATLTLFAAAMFIVKGIFQLILGFRLRPHDGWGWIVISGVIALIVGLLIYIQWPMSTAYAIGTLAGISLAFTGWSYVMIALAGRRMTG